MSRQEIRDKVRGAIEYLTAHPDEASYTDSPATARLDSPDGLTVTTTGPNGARLATDMPTSVGGADSAASPGWYLRAAQASGVTTLIAMRAAHEDVALTEVEVTVDSESNDYGILGIDETAAGPSSVRVAVRIRSHDATPEQLREIVDWAVKHTPHMDALARKVPVRLEIDAG